MSLVACETLDYRLLRIAANHNKAVVIISR